ncbi:hypothetical protein [Anaerovibrio sp. RM50]|uniref:hypothetical protein n=1 Tax=Anaerovibrio sp. RM50 TaxID=1200557 RepID=UPI0004801CB5|nr:hypothetical protein [Anaerovibrio sp. RM50]
MYQYGGISSLEAKTHFGEFDVDKFNNIVQEIISSFCQHFIDSQGYFDEEKSISTWLVKELTNHGLDESQQAVDEIMQLCEQLEKIEKILTEAILQGKDITLWLYSQLRPDVDMTDDEDFGCPISIHSLLEMYRQSIIAREIVFGSLPVINILPGKIFQETNYREANYQQIGKFQGKTQVNSSIQQVLMQQYQRQMQLDISYSMTSYDMSICAVDDMAYILSKNALLMGTGSLALSAAFSLGQTVIRNKRLGGEFYGISKELLRPGAKRGLRLAFLGAMKIGAARNALPIIGMASSGTLLGIATVGVECCDAMYRYTNEGIEAWQAVDQAGRASVASICAMTMSAQGAVVGAATFTGMMSCIPLVSPLLVGQLVGAGAGIFAGNILGQKAYELARGLAVYSYERAREYINTETLLEMPKVMVGNIRHEAQKLYTGSSLA